MGIERLNYIFPFGNSDSDMQRRDLLFRTIDTERQGMITLKQILAGMESMDEEYAIVKKNPNVVRSAFQSQFEQTTDDSSCINMDKFKFMLVYLRQYFEYFDVFDRMDINKD